MTFTSHDVAYDFHNSYARDNGFSIRKNKAGIGKPSHIICVIGGLFVPDKENVAGGC